MTATTEPKPRRIFLRDEDGLALTEYLLLLGLLSGGILISLALFSTSLGNAWSSWTGFYNVIPRPIGNIIGLP